MTGYINGEGNVVPVFAEMCVVLAEALGAKISEQRIRIYANLLGDVPLHELQQAFRRAANERASGFFPSPGELRKYISGNEDDAGLLAWAGLWRMASEVGAYSSVRIEDGAAAAALETVFSSWPSFCEQAIEGPAMHVKRQEFLAAYRAARRRVHPPVRRLAGLCEQADTHFGTAARNWIGVLTSGGLVTAVRDSDDFRRLLTTCQ